MYLNLTMRNAGRSLKDYLIYMITLTVLIAIICLSNIVSAISAETGLSGSSLPALILLIAIAMLDYMNQFFLRQRAKELATYSLLGMNKDRIALLVCGELLLLGVVCLFLGTALGGSLFVLFSLFSHSSLEINLSVLGIFGQNIGYLLLIEFFTALLLRRRIKKVQLSQLVDWKAQQDSPGKRSLRFWKRCLCLNTLVTISIFGLIFWDIQGLGLSLSSVVSMPLIFNIFVAYKTLFAWLNHYRKPENTELYTSNRLVRVSKLLSRHRANTVLHTILSLCLLFAFSSLTFSSLLQAGLFPDFSVTAYMIFLQRMLCFIFVFLYFTLLSLIQMIDSYQTQNDFRILHYLGKDKLTLKKYALTDIATRFLLPIATFGVTLVILLTGSLFSDLSQAVTKTVFATAGSFLILFVLLGSSFTLITYRLNVKLIEKVVQA
ncbi:FtsX-like permease family protein [Enterococcus sp. AZ109]|uniref:FtsX-like permease family protein n=1 Tax=Enterococcus sp. AZ109 TaxID=2774634 RepID=UPI003F244497